MNFVFDIDGTLCFDGKTIDGTIVNALHELSLHGHEVIFASARPIRDLAPVVPPQFRKGKLVGGNGCFTSENGTILTNHFEDDLMEQLFSIIEKNQLSFLADGEWDYAYTGSKDHPIYQNIHHHTAKNYAISTLPKVCKLVLFNPTDIVIQELQSLPVNITFYKNEDAIDINPFGMNKVSGLQKLQIYDFIAFGNDSNDQCLFEHAQYSVCVGENDVHKYASKKISKEEVAETIILLKNEF